MTRRTVAPVALAVAAVTAVLTWSSGLTRAGGVDVFDGYEAAEQQHAAEVDRCEQLSDEIADLGRRNAVKRGLVAGLVAGRVELAEVAATFLELDESQPRGLSTLRGQFPDGPDLKRAARSVLVWVSTRTAADPDRLARIEAAFRAMFPG